MNVHTMRLYSVYIHLMLRRHRARSFFHDHLDDTRRFEQSLASAFRCKDPVFLVAMFLGNKKEGLRLLKEAKVKAPGAKRVALGPFAAAFHRQLLERGLADMVVLSDPDFSVPFLCRSGWRPDKARNVAFYDKGRVALSRARAWDSLDLLPFAGDYFCQHYPDPLPILTARGCTFRCSFCDRPLLWGGRLRKRSIENVLAEIRHLLRRYQARHYVFDDADLSLDKKRLTLLCRGLMKLPQRVFWSCSARVDGVDRSLLCLMRHAGCDIIYFGVESGDVAVLKRLGKKYGRREIVDAVTLAREAGLRVGIFLTVGNPGETARSLKATKKLLRDLQPLAEVTVNPLVALPGTKLYADMVKAGAIGPDEYLDTDEIRQWNGLPEEKC